MLNTDVITDIKTVYDDPRTAGVRYAPGTVIRYVSADTKEILVQRSGSTGDMVTLASVLTPPIVVPVAFREWTFEEGTGSTLTDTVASATAVSSSGDLAPLWCEGDVRRRDGISYVKNGWYTQDETAPNYPFRSAFLAATAIPQTLTSYSVSVLVRVMEGTRNGCVFRAFTEATQITALFLNPATLGMIVAFGASEYTTETALIERGQWSRITLVQDDGELLLYVDRTLVHTETTSTVLGSGGIWFGAYASNSMDFPGDMTRLTVYDHAISANDVVQLCRQDGSLPDEWYLFSHGDSYADMRLLEERPELPGDDPTVSRVLLATGDIAPAFDLRTHDGLTCWAAVDHPVPSSVDGPLYVHSEWYFPDGLTSNVSEVAKQIQVLAVFSDMARDSFLHEMELALDYESGANPPITLGHVRYTDDTGLHSVDLPDTVVAKDRWHSFDLVYTPGATGTVSFYWNGSLVHTQSGDMTGQVVHAMHGVNLGIHPTHPIDYIYLRNCYTGTTPYIGGVRITTPDDTVAENSGTFTITVALPSAQAETISVYYELSGTAVESVDYTVSPALLSFAPGQTTRDITVTLLEPEYQSDVTLTTTITEITGTLSLGAPTVHSLTIQSVDEPTSTLPAPVYNFAADEGTGTTVEDKVNHGVLTTDATSLNWANGNVMGHTGRNYLVFSADGSGYGRHTVDSPNIITSTLTTHSESILLRRRGGGHGAFIRDLEVEYNYTWDANGIWMTDSAPTIAAEDMAPIDTWFRFTATLGGGVIKMYINGAEMATATTSVPALTAGGFRVGGFMMNSNLSEGDWCDLRIWDVVLTPEQVAELAADDL